MDHSAARINDVWDVAESLLASRNEPRTSGGAATEVMGLCQKQFASDPCRPGLDLRSDVNRLRYPSWQHLRNRRCLPAPLGKLRDELLVREVFDTLLEAKVLNERPTRVQQRSPVKR